MDFKQYLIEEEKNLQCEEEEKGGMVKGTHVRRFKARAIKNLRQFRQSQGKHGKLDAGEESFIGQRVKSQEVASTTVTPKKQEEATDRLPEYDLRTISSNILSRENLSSKERSELAKRVGSGMGDKIQRRREKLQAQGMYRAIQAPKK